MANFFHYPRFNAVEIIFEWQLDLMLFGVSHDFGNRIFDDFRQAFQRMPNKYDEGVKT